MDLKAVGQLTGKDRLISNGVPFALGMGIVGGEYVARGCLLGPHLRQACLRLVLLRRT